jgi:release factor H-coupled RctB family protein
MRGTGSPAGLYSVAHGSGRRITRADARRRFKEKHGRKGVRRTPLGGRVICDDDATLFEEHPDAYKPVEPVVRSIEQAGLATRVAAIEPVITVKR